MRINLDAGPGHPRPTYSSPALTGRGDVGGGTNGETVIISVKGFGFVEFPPFEAMVFAYALAAGLAMWGATGLPEGVRPKLPLVILPGNGAIPIRPTPRPGAG